MSLTIGVDPGNTGALAVYNTKTRKIVHIQDMPIFNMTINKKTRKRIDAVGVYEYFSYWQMAGVELVLIEAIGGRPKQNASAAFVLGYGVGLLYMACVSLKLPIETVPPQVWKRVMRVPGKKDGRTRKRGEPPADPVSRKDLDGAIVNRACELMPDARDNFYGPKGGLYHDRAEACMLAKYCGDHALKFETRPFLAVDTAIAYQHADTGA